MSSQQFHERVDQVAAGDIKNFIEAPRPEQPAPLSSAQLQVLEALVEEISKECGKESQVIWREVVFARVGVDSDSEILRDSFHDAHDSLVCYRDNHRRQANVRLMVSRITSLTKEKGIYNQRDAWCLRQFGEKHLNAMGTEQLRLVLAFVEDFLVEPVQEQPTDTLAATDTPGKSGFLPGLKDFVITYPMHCGAIALALMILGKIV